MQLCASAESTATGKALPKEAQSPLLPLSPEPPGTQQLPQSLPFSFGFPAFPRQPLLWFAFPSLWLTGAGALGALSLHHPPLAF